MGFPSQGRIKGWKKRVLFAPGYVIDEIGRIWLRYKLREKVLPPTCLLFGLSPKDVETTIRKDDSKRVNVSQWELQILQHVVISKWMVD